MNEIKPCPFCEEDNSCSVFSFVGMYWVYCHRCKSRGPSANKKEDAIATWNAAHTRILEAMRDQRHACAEAWAGSLMPDDYGDEYWESEDYQDTHNAIMNAEVRGNE